MMSNKHGLAAKTVSKWQPLKLIFQDKFLKIAGTSEAETSLTGKGDKVRSAT